MRDEFIYVLEEVGRSKEVFLEATKMYRNSSVEELKNKFSLSEYNGDILEIFDFQTIKKIFNGEHSSTTPPSLKKLRTTLYFMKYVFPKLYEKGSVLHVSIDDVDNCDDIEVVISRLSSLKPIARVDGSSDENNQNYFSGKTLVYALTMNGIDREVNLAGRSPVGVVGNFAFPRGKSIHLHDVVAYYVLDDGNLIENGRWHTRDAVYFDNEVGFLLKFALSPVDLKEGVRRVSHNSVHGILGMAVRDRPSGGFAFQNAICALQGELIDLLPERVSRPGRMYGELFTTPEDEIFDELASCAGELLKRVR